MLCRCQEPNAIMKLIIGLLATCLLTLSGCQDRYPLKVDYETASIQILGQEKCFINQEDNAWLVSLTPIDPGKEYGVEIVYNGTTYANVVRVKHDLSKEYENSSVKHYFEFYTDAPQTQTCTVEDPETYQAPFIRIKTVIPGG